ncbi:bro-b [Cryptophlebia peltastica nucleopolyhedrovirus]|uniref:Bro-b n=1 Tax=Cryptophlebia peltastica nucleopolyhedrovirus TaxID=2304025 RepID=A0A346RNR9_9ABAC|nr:bro-b [Cryptophlebia peltastica nucleopolyhedrovirus]AXS67716.1 bro-b [Cryptophlebia peltastica nucleopolyhedrovirus]
MRDGYIHDTIHAPVIPEGKAVLYVATTKTYAQNDQYKIGYTTRIHGRLSSFNCGRAEEDKMYYCLYTRPMYNCAKLKRLLKKKLSSHQCGGDMFRLSLEELENLIVKCCIKLKKVLH